MGVTNDETTDLGADDPVPSGASAPKKPETYTAGPPPDLKASARFYDSVLSLPAKDRESVIDEMHPEDLKGFLAYTSIPGAGAGKATPESAPETAKTEPPAAVPYAPGIKPTPEGETTTEVTLVNKDGSPVIGHLDRALAQNVANDAEGQAAYYRKNYPNLEFGVFSAPGRGVDQESAQAMNDPAAGKYAGMGIAPQQTGAGQPTDRVYARPKGSKVWSAVDPDTGFHPIDDPKEALQDVADRGYQIAAGVPTAMATAAGGLAMPAAPLLGAGVAGGTVNAALEGVRQAIGAGLGMNKSPDWSLLGDAFGSGFLTPFLFGTGATPEAAAAKGVDYGAQRGYPGQLFDKVAPGVSRWISGIPSDDIRFARNNLPEIKAAERQGQGALDAKTRQAMDGVRESLMDMQDSAWNDIQNAIDQTKTPVDISHAKDALQGRIAALSNKPMATAGEREQLAALKSEYDRAFFQQPQGELRQRFEDEAKANAANIAALQEHLTPELAPSLAAMKQRQAMLEQALSRGIEVPDQVGAKDALRIKSMLSDTANWRTAGGDRYGKLNEAERGVQLAGSDAYGALNDAIDTAVAQAGQSYKGLNQKYAAAKALQEFLRPFMGDGIKDEVKSAQYLRNINEKGNSKMRDALATLDQQYPGHNIIHNANMLNAITTFSNPSTTALNGYGSTSTTKTNNAANIFGTAGGILGGLAGFFGGGGADGDLVHALTGAGTAGWAGKEAGKAIGPLAASPSALRMYMNIGNGMRAVGTPFRKAGQVLSPWAIEEIKRENQ